MNIYWLSLFVFYPYILTPIYTLTYTPQNLIFEYDEKYDIQTNFTTVFWESWPLTLFLSSIQIVTN